MEERAGLHVSGQGARAPKKIGQTTGQQTNWKIKRTLVRKLVGKKAGKLARKLARRLARKMARKMAWEIVPRLGQMAGVRKDNYDRGGKSSRGRVANITTLSQELHKTDPRLKNIVQRCPFLTKTPQACHVLDPYCASTPLLNEMAQTVIHF